jgi:diaminopimelate dehydrogenase
MGGKMRVAVLGYGNIGKHAVDAVEFSPDMELAGIVELPERLQGPVPEVTGRKALAASIGELQRVDVALLCIPSRSVPGVAPPILARGIHTVDSYDIHGQLADLRRSLDQAARGGDAVAVTGAGWDPGTDSIVRCMFEFMAPRGITYTDFGPGMSMGHSVAARAVAGVADALAITIPAGAGIHRRMVYVRLRPGSDFEDVAGRIKQDPYFAHDETIVRQVEDVTALLDVGHGVSMERKGVSGVTHNQRLHFSMKINTPALTAQIMVASARAASRQKPGAYTLIEIPVIDFMFGEREAIIRERV